MVDDPKAPYKAKYCCLPGQKTLFPIKNLASFETEKSVSADEMKRWHDKGWLSFNPFDLSEFDEPQWVEIEFVKAVARFGLTDDWIDHILASLDEPYCYNPKNTFYSFADKCWKTAPEPIETLAKMKEIAYEYIQKLGDVGKLEELTEMRDEINDMLENQGEDVE